MCWEGGGEPDVCGMAIAHEPDGGETKGRICQTGIQVSRESTWPSNNKVTVNAYQAPRFESWFLFFNRLFALTGFCSVRSVRKDFIRRTELPVMFLAAQASYNNCNFSSHSPRHKRLFHGNAYEKAAKAYQIEKCNSFHWSHFREKRSRYLARRGGWREGGSGRLVSVCVCVCVCVCVRFSSVYGAFKSLQMCCGLRPTSPPQTLRASCQRGLTVKINSTDTADGELWGVFAAESESLTLFLACKTTLPLPRFYFYQADKSVWANPTSSL